ncbi:uncharacterized protein [Drosophila pseudoobscura]|uniref:Proteasome activator PA28 C-terminal domain-containing protein n=1 Tax=Drosophila pseudoobscura pseudoobscura TaxID=46245 RepID=A0A6I8V1C9_DROPS|nr:uncharacterized protein LOC6900091 [Drosophila pseudoobscura]
MAANGAEQGLLLKVMLVDSLFESLDLVITQNFPSTIFRLNELLAAPMFNNPMFADEPPGCRLPPELKWAQTCRLQPVVALTAETTRVINCLFGYCSIVEELVEGMKREVEHRGYADVRTHNEILSLLRAIQSATPLYYELMNIYNRTRQRLTDLMAESPGHKKHYLCRIYHTDKTEYQALCNIVWRVRNDFSAIQNMVLEHWDDLKPAD